MLPEVDKLRTTVAAADVPRIAAPTLASVQAAGLAIPARLVRLPAAAAASTQTRTVIVTGAPPLTRMARGASAAVAMRGADADGTARLNAMTGALAGAGVNRQPDSAATTLQAGELAVLQLPNAIRDVDPHARRPRIVTTGAARVVALGHGGEVLADLARGGADVRRLGDELLEQARALAVRLERVRRQGRGGPFRPTPEGGCPSRPASAARARALGFVPGGGMLVSLVCPVSGSR